MIFAETSRQAELYLDTIKEELTTNAAIERDFPEAFGEGPVWSSSTILTRNGVRVDALGAGKAVRGSRKAQHRPTIIIVDDPEGEEATFSALRRERIFKWFSRAVMKLGSPATNTLVAGTKLHRDCLVAKLQKMPGWSSREFRSIEKWPERMDLWGEWEEIYSDQTIGDEARSMAARSFFETNRAEMERGASVLWPERESLYDLMAMRAEDHVSFENEKQNNPVDPAACEWPASYFDYAGFWFEAWPGPGALTVKTIGLDPSKGKESRKGDYAATVQLARDREGYLYVEADLVRRPSDAICQGLIELQKDFRADGVAIETNQFQELLAKDIARQSSERGIMIPIFEVENTVNKLVRIRRLGPLLSRRLLRFKTRSPGTQLLIDQLRDFPVGSHDDGPDALEMALRLAIEIHNGRARAATDEKLIFGG